MEWMLRAAYRLVCSLLLVDTWQLPEILRHTYSTLNMFYLFKKSLLRFTVLLIVYDCALIQKVNKERAYISL